MNDRIKPGTSQEIKLTPMVMLENGEAERILRLRHHLLRQGFLPIKMHGKLPRHKDWNYIVPDHDLIDKGLNPGASRTKWPSTSVFVQGRLLVIDIDVPDPSLVQQIMQHVYRIAPQLAGVVAAPVRGRTGSSKLAVFALRPEGEEQFVMRSDSFAEEEGGVADYKVEVWSTERGLTKGQFLRQFVVDGPHTIAEDGTVKSSYRWEGPGNEPPAIGDVPMLALPVVTKAQMEQVIDAAAAVLRGAGLYRAEKRSVHSGPPAVLYDLTDDMTFLCRGVMLTMAQLIDAAEADGELRVSGGFTGTGTGTRDDRCSVHFREEFGRRFVVITDFRDYTTHYPAWLKDVGNAEPAAPILPPEFMKAIAEARPTYDAEDEDDQPVKAAHADTLSMMPSRIVEEASPEPEVVYVPPSGPSKALIEMRASGYVEGFVAAFLSPLMASSFRYLWKDERWLLYRAGIWAECPAGVVDMAARLMLDREFEARRDEAARVEDEEDREALLASINKHRNRANTTTYSRALRSMLQGESILYAQRSDFDREPWLMGVPGGLALDLRTQKLREARPEDMLTRCLACAPADEADCPEFMRFLSFISGDASWPAFFARFFGRAMVGDTAMRKFLYLAGSGSNGKSTLIEVIGKLLGSYAKPVNKMFTVDSHGRTGTRKLIYNLDGVRYGYSGEARKGEVWDDALLKSVVSGDIVSERRMHADDDTEMAPVITLAFAGNSLPKIGTNDPAIRNRLIAAELENELDDSPANITLRHRLPIEEGPGILRWLLNGLADHEKGGLRIPVTMTEFADDYVESEDRIAPLLKTLYAQSDNPDDRIDRNEVRSEVLSRIAAKDVDGLGMREIGNAMKRVFPQVAKWSHRSTGLKQAKTNSVNYWVGLKRARSTVTGSN